MDDTGWQSLSLKGELGCHGSRMGKAKCLAFQWSGLWLVERGLMSGGGGALSEGIKQAYWALKTHRRGGRGENTGTDGWMRWKREPGLSRRRSPLWRIKASLNFLFLPSLSPVPPSLFLTFILMCNTSKQDSFGSSAFIFGMEQCTVFLFSSLIFLIKHLLLSLFSHSYWALTETVCLPFSFFFFLETTPL